MDAQMAVAQGLLDEPGAARVQQVVVASVDPLDREYKRDLAGKLRTQLGTRLLATTPAAALPAESEEALKAFAASLQSLYERFPQDLYLALYG
jgi:hypothetical protein